MSKNIINVLVNNLICEPVQEKEDSQAGQHTTVARTYSEGGWEGSLNYSATSQPGLWP